MRVLRVQMLRNWCFTTAIFFLVGCSANGGTVFSSRTSPDGSHVAESIMLGDGEAAGGEILIRAKDGFVQQVASPEITAKLFLRWVDDQTLEVWSERKPLNFRGNDRLGDVRIVAKSFDFPRDVGSTYSRPGLKTQSIAVSSEKVVATFANHAKDEGKLCILTIGTPPDPGYDAAQIEIAAGVFPHSNGSSAGIQTHFFLGDNRHLSPQSMLTSATVSNIPSYNRLPTGSEGTSIRGQFLEQNAVSLIDAIKSGSVTLDFSRNFFDDVILYALPLSDVKKPVEDFESCLGDADFLWMHHRH